MDPLTWLPIIIAAGVYILVDKIMNMILVQQEVMGFVYLISILAFLVLILLCVWYLKNRQDKGGDEDKNGSE